MRIRTLLITAFAGALAIALGLIGVIGVLDYRYQRYAHAQETAQGVLRETSALLVLTHEYALHAEDRPVQQWHSRFANIKRVLQQASETDEGASTIALEQAKAIEATFTQLITLRDNPSTETSQRRTNLLFDQLLMQTQALFDTLQRWSDEALAQRRSTEALTQRLVYVIPALILVVLGLLTT